MEFDTTVKLKTMEEFAISSKKSEEDFLKDIWDICQKRASYVGDAGNGEFWLDYSTSFKTKYVRCGISPDAEDKNKYRIIIKGGAKADRSGDAIVIILALFAFWCLSKLFVPSPPVIFIMGLIFFVSIIIGFFFFFRQDFGKDEAANLRYEIENIRKD